MTPISSPTARRVTRMRGSMDTIIRRSPRHHEWNPRIRQLQFGRVKRCRHRTIAFGLRELTRFESRGDLLQRVTRFDLRVPASIDEWTGRCRQLRDPRRLSIGLEHFEPRLIDRLERQLKLEPRL